jgi:predicted site-specific integrase-resolvase
MHGRNGGVGGFHADPTTRLFTMSEITGMFRVTPRTVTRWVRSGRVTVIRLPGGRTRFRAEEIRYLLSTEPD